MQTRHRVQPRVSDSLDLETPKLAFLASFPVTLMVGLLRHALSVTERGKYQSILKQRSPTFSVLGTSFVEDSFYTEWQGDGFRMIQACYIYCANDNLYF